jgi:hypothetical protein
MLKVTERKNPNALAQLQELIDGALLDMAEVGAEDLRRNLSAGNRSGVQYPSLPRRSSAPGEMPQEQSGRLKSMVVSGVLEPGVAYFGFEPDGHDEREQALALELGAPRNNLIARAPIRRTALDPRTQSRMKAAAQRRR